VTGWGIEEFCLDFARATLAPGCAGVDAKRVVCVFFSVVDIVFGYVCSEGWSLGLLHKRCGVDVVGIYALSGSGV